MHDPVDNPADQTSSLAALTNGDGESTAGVTTAPGIEPDTGGIVASDDQGQDVEARREKVRLVIPTMWR